MILLGVAWVLPGALVSCGPEAPATIERQTFVDVYVELRAAALDDTNALISPSVRDGILSNHGITAEDLVEFAEVHAGDPEFMRGVWDEIEERLNVVSLESS